MDNLVKISIYQNYLMKEDILYMRSRMVEEGASQGSLWSNREVILELRKCENAVGDALETRERRQ